MSAADYPATGDLDMPHHGGKLDAALTDKEAIRKRLRAIVEHGPDHLVIDAAEKLLEMND